MKRTTSIALIGVSLLTFGTIAYAQNAAPVHAEAGMRAPMDRAALQNRLGTMFDAMDANRDGVATVDERNAHHEAGRTRRDEARSTAREEMFTRLDADKNGSLSREEFASGVRAFHGPGRNPDGAREQPRSGKGEWAGRGERGDRTERGERDGKRERGAHRRHGDGFGSGMMMHGQLAEYKDKPISRAVFIAAGLTGFDRVDTDRDGKISPVERDAARKAMMDRRDSTSRPIPPKPGS